jgi:hypothetical protein
MKSISCPFCNANVPVDQLCQTGTKVLCPRCGEPLPPRLVEDLPTRPASETALPLTSTWTNRKIGLAVLGAMLLMAVMGLVLALLTQESRRQNDYRLKRGATLSPAVAAPGELTGLGFLPPEVNVVAAVQIAELLKDQAGKRLLEAPRPAPLELLLSTVAKWTRLEAEDLEHVVLGTEIKAKLPQVTMIVQTRRPFDPARLAKSLYPALPTLQRGKPLYRLPLKAGEGILWCPEPRTLVFLFRLDALKVEDLNAIPFLPRTGTDAAPRAIQPILEAQRVSKQSLAWMAGRLDEPDLVEELSAFAPLPAGAGQFLTGIRAFGLSLLSQEGLVLVGYFQTSDDKMTRVIQKQLEELKLKNLQSMKVEVPPPDVTDPAAQWLTLQIRGDAEALREALGW